jgi:hypothetical protein
MGTSNGLILLIPAIFGSEAGFALKALVPGLRRDDGNEEGSFEVH